MAFFEGNKMTGGYGDGPDIISSCTINVNKGEIVAILGPNGAGKSTAMKAMLGLLNLKSGNVLIEGEDISKLSPQERVKKNCFQCLHLKSFETIKKQKLHSKRGGHLSPNVACSKK